MRVRIGQDVMVYAFLVGRWAWRRGVVLSVNIDHRVRPLRYAIVNVDGYHINAYYSAVRTLNEHARLTLMT